MEFVTQQATYSVQFMKHFAQISYTTTTATSVYTRILSVHHPTSALGCTTHTYPTVRQRKTGRARQSVQDRSAPFASASRGLETEGLEDALYSSQCRSSHRFERYASRQEVRHVFTFLFADLARVGPGVLIRFGYSGLEYVGTC